MSRREVLRGVAVAAGAVSVAPLWHGGAAQAATDAYQRNVQLVPGGNGVIYAVQADGALLWFQHTGWRDGSRTWANGGAGVPIGTAWQQFHTVLGSADGQIFGFRANGDVLWYKYTPNRSNLSRPGTWHPNSGALISTGFEVFPRVFGGWDGVIYGINAAGELYWHRYVAGDGSAGPGAWAPLPAGSDSTRIGTSWHRYPQVWADQNGVILAGSIEGNSNLYWWRYLAGDGSDGAGAWANNAVPYKVGEGHYPGQISNGAGTMYAVTLDTGTTPGYDSILQWSRLTNSETIVRDGGPRWANGGYGVTVGDRFTMERGAALQGYGSRLSAAPGEVISFAVSTTFSSYSASVVQLGTANGAGGPLWSGSQPGRFQTLPQGFRANGCGWAYDFGVTIPASWPSGVYEARLVGMWGLTSAVPFVVRPTAPAAKLAFLLPTNTYHAYNDWGGHNQYSDGQVGVSRTFSFHRPSRVTNSQPDGVINHTLYSDLLLLRWLAQHSIAVDVYHDGDLDSDGSWLGDYRGLILGSHAEYWTQAMRDRLVAYLDNGGRLIATGANSVFERIAYSADRTAATFRTPSGARDTFAGLGKPPSQIVGATDNDAVIHTFQPYKVVGDVRLPDGTMLLDGTGLRVGDTFGATGYNGAASGWEVNFCYSSDDRAGLYAVAIGQNRDQQGNAAGATMLWIDCGDGGWTFATNSIAFNGSLPHDPACSVILANVLKQAIRG